MAAEQPLLLVAELQPPETAYFPVGGSVRVHLYVVDAEQRLQQDPDRLTFTLTAPHITPVVYVYGTDPQIVRVAQGEYYTDFSHTSPGKWKQQYIAILDSINCGSNTTQTIAVSS